MILLHVHISKVVNPWEIQTCNICVCCAYINVCMCNSSRNVFPIHDLEKIAKVWHIDIIHLYYNHWLFNATQVLLETTV